MTTDATLNLPADAYGDILDEAFAAVAAAHRALGRIHGALTEATPNVAHLRRMQRHLQRVMRRLDAALDDAIEEFAEDEAEMEAEDAEAVAALVYDR